MSFLVSSVGVLFVRPISLPFFFSVVVYMFSCIPGRVIFWSPALLGGSPVAHLNFVLAAGAMVVVLVSLHPPQPVIHVSGRVLYSDVCSVAVCIVDSPSCCSRWRCS